MTVPLLSTSRDYTISHVVPALGKGNEAFCPGRNIGHPMRTLHIVAISKWFELTMPHYTTPRTHKNILQKGLFVKWKLHRADVSFYCYGLTVSWFRQEPKQ